MLETAEGIENAEAIAAVDGIDCLLIGSGDLTTDYGIPGQVDHPRLRAAYERVAAACKEHGRILGVGGIRHNVALQGELVQLGARFVIAGTDTNYVLEPVGRPWQVRTQPSSTSSGVSALLARMRAEPSFKKAIQVAQLPASQENGGRRPPRRAVSSRVSPGW